MLGFHALGRHALGRTSVPGGESGESGEEFAPEAADFEWPFDDLKPRDIGLYPVAAPIGGGMALTGKEPTTDSGAGYWRIVYGAIRVRGREKILQYRALEANLEGRGRTIAIPIYDGKRAPWPSTPGGDIDAESFDAVAEGGTGIRVVETNIGNVQAGMFFSAGQRLYQIKAIQGESGVLDCEFWPPAREQIPAGTSLDFRRPVCIMRLATDDAMAAPLDGLKRMEPTIEFVEAL